MRFNVAAKCTLYANASYMGSTGKKVIKPQNDYNVIVVLFGGMMPRGKTTQDIKILTLISQNFLFKTEMKQRSAHSHARGHS